MGFKTKLKSDGTVERRKARLVALGYQQVQGIDFHDTFAPVVRFDTTLAILSISHSRKYQVHQMDVVTVLYGDLEEEIYMRVPEDVSAEHGKMWRWRKSLYGLRQSPRQWNLKLVSSLSALALKPPSMILASI